MNRGDVYVGSGAGFAGKPRPVVVIQSDAFPKFDSTVICLVTSDEDGGRENRVPVEPSVANGLEHPSWVMTEKIYSFRATQFREKIGKLSDGDMERVSEQLRKVLGL